MATLRCFHVSFVRFLFTRIGLKERWTKLKRKKKLPFFCTNRIRSKRIRTKDFLDPCHCGLWIGVTQARDSDLTTGSKTVASWHSDWLIIYPCNFTFQFILTFWFSLWNDTNSTNGILKICANWFIRGASTFYFTRFLRFCCSFCASVKLKCLLQRTRVNKL